MTTPTDAQPDPDDLWAWSATSIAEGIARGVISSREVVDAHIARIERVDPLLNAVVNKRFDAARKEAARADEAIARREDVGPLHGVPCTIKEFFGVEGMPRTGGMVRTKDFVATLWNAVAVPAGTPADVVDKLLQTTNQVLADKSFAEQMLKLGIESSPPRTLKETRDFIAQEQARWKPVVEAAGVSSD